MHTADQTQAEGRWCIGVNRSWAGSAGTPSEWSVEEGVRHPGSRSTAVSQDDTNSADPAPTELCTDELLQPDNHNNSPLLMLSAHEEQK